MERNVEKALYWGHPEFWEHFERLEIQHREARAQYEMARHELDRMSFAPAATWRPVWTLFLGAVGLLEQTAQAIADLQWVGIESAQRDGV